MEKKFNKSEVMKKAWMFVKNAGLTLSEGLKKAWRMVKFTAMVASQKAEVLAANAAFDAKDKQARQEVAVIFSQFANSFVVMRCGKNDVDNDLITMSGTRLYNAE